MNKQDRVELQKASAMIDEARAIIEAIGEGEQEKFDNLTEGFQNAERGQRMEEVAGELAELAETLNEAIGTLESVQE